MTSKEVIPKSMAAKQALAAAITPSIRLITRYISCARKPVYMKFVEPVLAWRTYPYSVKTHFGARVTGDTRDLIQRYIYFFGCWEPHVEAYITSALKPGATFIDVGANIGYYTLLGSRLVGESGTVIGIEACTSTFRRLSDHVAMSPFRNVRLVNKAASDAMKIIDLYIGPPGNSGANSIIRRSASSQQVQAAPLDSIVSAREAASTGIIKIDVEGAEPTVVAGMRNVLSNLPAGAEVIMELTPEISDTQQILQAMGTYGFHAYAMPSDTIDNYFRPKRYEAVRITQVPAIRTDTLFSRRNVERILY